MYTPKGSTMAPRLRCECGFSSSKGCWTRLLLEYGLPDAQRQRRRRHPKALATAGSQPRQAATNHPQPCCTDLACCRGDCTHLIRGGGEGGSDSSGSADVQYIEVIECPRVGASTWRRLPRTPPRTQVPPHP